MRAITGGIGALALLLAGCGGGGGAAPTGEGETLESLEMSAEDREKIYAGNARRVLGVT